MALIDRIAQAMKEKLATDDEIYFRDDGRTCTIDGHVDMVALATAALDAVVLDEAHYPKGDDT